MQIVPVCLVLVATLALAAMGCRGDGPFYVLRVTNSSSRVLLIDTGILIGTYEAPADGQERITDTIPLDAPVGEVSVFDENCTLVATVAVKAGIYDLDIDSAGKVVLSVTQPPVNDVPTLDKSLIECP
jgi:hypothetical protein